MRHHGERIEFAPRLPERFGRLAFTLELRGRRVRVDIRSREATYTLVEGEPLEIHHHGQPLTVDADKPHTRDIPRLTPRPAPEQPLHRRPNGATAAQN